MGANDVHAVKTLQEAEAFPGPSIVIAYSHCIAHGYDMAMGASQQQSAVKSGYWPLFRYNPLKEKGSRFTLDSRDPSLPVKDFIYNETRFSVLTRQYPQQAANLLSLAEQGISDRWEMLNLLKGM